MIPSSLEISGADIKRGYVERRHATGVTADKGARVIWVADPLPPAAVFSQMTIGTEKDTATTHEKGRQRIDQSRPLADLLLLDFQFKLLRGMKPGRYSWPVSVEVFIDH